MSPDPIEQAIADIQKEIDRLEAAKASLVQLTNGAAADAAPEASPAPKLRRFEPQERKQSRRRGQRPIATGKSREKVEAVLGQKEMWRQSQLAEAAGVPKGSMAGVIAGLEKDGMLRIERRSVNDVRLHVQNSSVPLPV